MDGSDEGDEGGEGDEEWRRMGGLYWCLSIAAARHGGASNGIEEDQAVLVRYLV